MAALDTTCLDGVVGLAHCACPCIEPIAPEGWNESASGLFVADLVSLEMLEGAADCADPANPWNALDDARRQGLNMTLADLRREMSRKSKPRTANFVGIIGERSAREVRSLSTTYAGARISAPNIRGGYLQIKKIGGVFNANGTVTVKVWDRFNVQVGEDVAITTTAGIHAQTACNINLPLFVEGAPNPEYFLAYTVNQSNLPRANTLYCTPCGRGAIPSFSTAAPYYGRQWHGSNSWANWAMVGGWVGDSLTQFDIEAEAVTAGSNMNGLTIECEITCDPASCYCRNGIDYSTAPGLSLAHAAYYACGIKMAEKIIRATSPVRNAAVSREILAIEIEKWHENYQKNIQYAAHYAPIELADCSVCAPAVAMSVRGKTS